MLPILICPGCLCEYHSYVNVRKVDVCFSFGFVCECIDFFLMNHSNCGLGSYVGMSVLHTYEGYSEIVFIYVDVVCVCV